MAFLTNGKCTDFVQPRAKVGSNIRPWFQEASKLLANYQLGATIVLLDSPMTLQICAFAKFDYANNLCYIVRISEN